MDGDAANDGFAKAAYNQWRARAVRSRHSRDRGQYHATRRWNAGVVWEDLPPFEQERWRTAVHAVLKA
jgi:hypothetical protein